MANDSDTTGPAESKSPWLGIGRFLLVVALIVMFFMLGRSMVHHRFFRGGWVDRHGTLRP
jgi:hypothetical protein